MQVTAGPYIDVFFFDSDNYKYFQDGEEFELYSAMSDYNTKYANNEITLSEHGTYYLVFDNTDAVTDPPWNMVDDTAYVSWTLNSDITYYDSGDNWDDGESDPFMMYWVLCGVGLIVIVVVIVVIVALIFKKRQSPPQQPGYPPVQPPYQQPPQYPPTQPQPPPPQYPQ